MKTFYNVKSQDYKGKWKTKTNWPLAEDMIGEEEDTIRNNIEIIQSPHCLIRTIKKEKVELTDS